MTKTTKILAIATVTAITGIASAQAESRVTPILRAEVTYTNSGYKQQQNFNGIGTPKGFEVGPGLTAGVIIDKKHEISLSTGYTKFEGNLFVDPGFNTTTLESEQIPVLLNYRYHLALDKAERYTVFAGPTVGFIHEKFTETNTQLGGLAASAVGSFSDSAWKLAYGGTVGLKAELGKGWELTATAQALRVSGNTYSIRSGSVYTFDSAIRPSFALAVGYSW
jgi:hypothetical protein